MSPADGHRCGRDAMELTSGLYMAYELVKGVGTLVGVDAKYVGLADGLVAIAKLMPRPSRDAAAVADDVSTTIGPAAREVRNLNSLLLLLAHSSVTIDVPRLREGLSRITHPITIGNTAFVGHEHIDDLRIGDLPSLQHFNALSEATISWNAARRCFLIRGLVDRTPLRPLPPSTIELSGSNASHKVETSHGSGSIKFYFERARRSAVTPITWRQELPTTKILHCSADQEILLAEIVAPYSSTRVVK